MSGAAGDLRARQPKAIHSALTVLEEVARCGAGVTARQVSDNLGLPRATTYRLLNLLVQDEYLVRMPDLTGFALGRKVVELAQLVAPPRPPEAVRLVVTELRGRIRGGVHLVRYDRDGLHVIDADPDYPPTVTGAGSRPLHESAMGRLLLAERSSPTVTEVRELGFARQFGAVTADSGCLAVPIRDRDGTLVAALCLAAPRARIEQPGEHLLLLQQAAVTLAPLLA